jgi:hypothetical protein
MHGVHLPVQRKTLLFQLSLFVKKWLSGEKIIYEFIASIQVNIFLELLLYLLVGRNVGFKSVTIS